MTAHESNDNNLVMTTSAGWGRWSRDERQEEWSVDLCCDRHKQWEFFFVMLQKVRARKDSAQAASPAGHDPAAEALAAEAQGQPVPV